MRPRSIAQSLHNVKVTRGALPHASDIVPISAAGQADSTMLVSQQTLDSTGKVVTSASNAPTTASPTSGTKSSGGGKSFPIWAIVILVILGVLIVLILTGDALYPSTSKSLPTLFVIIELTFLNV